jgi:hypothetical protein
VLNNNNILLNGSINVLVSKNYKQLPVINSIIYLEDQSDYTIITYMNNILDNIFNNYIFNGFLTLQQTVTDLYFKTINTLFNNYTIGLTTFTNINNIALNYDLDISDIVFKENILPDNDYNPFILPLSYSIYNITDINSYLLNIETTNNNNLQIYNDNKNILNLNQITYENISENYSLYLKNKNHIEWIRTDGTTGGTHIIEVTAIYDVKVNDYVGFYSSSNIYKIYKVIAINYITNTNYSNKINKQPIYAPITITIESNGNEIPTINPNNKQIYYGIECLQLNNYIPSLYSSINIRNAVSYIIFNNFSFFDNVYYDDFFQSKTNQYNYWYYYDNNNNNIIQYFTIYPGKQTRFDNFSNYPIDYPVYIIQQMKAKYKIKDLSILSKAFNKVFQLDTELFTIDNIIYKLCQIINSSNNNNTYYPYIYLIQSMNNFLNDSKFLNNTFININNIQYLINNFNDPQTILILANHTNDTNLFKYNLYSINTYSLNPNTKDSTIKIVLSNDLIHSFVSPYNNFNINDNFNIDYSLRNKCITTYIKFTDIDTVIKSM